jgi:MFS family permease
VIDRSTDQTVPEVTSADPEAPASRVTELTRGLDRALGFVAGLSFASNLIVGAMLPILPLFAVAVGASPRELALIVSVSAVATAGGLMVGGFATERFGPRRLLPAGFAFYGIATLLTSIAGSVAPILTWRLVAGLGSGAYIVGERLYVRQVADRTRLAFANGVLQTAASAGLIIGPVLGGAVADASDLRTPIVAVGIAGVVMAVVSMLLPARRRPDSADTPPASDAPVHLDRLGLSVLLLAEMALVAGYGSFITTFAPFAADVRRWSTTEIGIAFSLFALGNLIAAPWIGAAADKWGRSRVGAVATLPITVFAVALLFPISTAILYLLVLGAGAGVAGFTASWFATLGAATGGPQGGRAFGIVTSISSLGIVVGALLAGQLWEALDIRDGMAVTVVAMVLAGVFMALYGDRPRVPRPMLDPEPA